MEKTAVMIRVHLSLKGNSNRTSCLFRNIETTISVYYIRLQLSPNLHFNSTPFRRVCRREGGGRGGAVKIHLHVSHLMSKRIKVKKLFLRVCGDFISSLVEFVVMKMHN